MFFFRKHMGEAPCHEQLNIRDYKSQKFFPMC
jgi:hypothetical protein